MSRGGRPERPPQAEGLPHLPHEASDGAKRRTIPRPLAPGPRPRAALVTALLLLAGCGRYADFELPRAAGLRSTAFAFEPKLGAVLGRGGHGEWDSGDALNPSVVWREGAYFNFYSGFDGKTWHTGLATSVDGVSWRKVGRVLSPDARTWEGDYIAANGSALWHAGEFWYWYQAGPKELPRLGLARSHDGRAWVKHPKPVLETGPRGSWDERGLGDPYVVRMGANFYMYYLGQDRARRQRLGVARSADGVRWQKLRASPVLELGGPGAFDEAGLGEPAVWAEPGAYWMLYTGRDRAENRRLGLARSRDGVRWEKVPAVFAGAEDWNRRVVCDPAVEPLGDSVRVWFGGGDVASPDENLHGQIGLAVLRPVGATLER